jgi:hypothetical protein
VTQQKTRIGQQRTSKCQTETEEHNRRPPRASGLAHRAQRGLIRDGH